MLHIANPADQASLHPQRDAATEELTGYVLYLSFDAGEDGRDFLMVNLTPEAVEELRRSIPAQKVS